MNRKLSSFKAKTMQKPNPMLAMKRASPIPTPKRELSSVDAVSLPVQKRQKIMPSVNVLKQPTSLQQLKSEVRSLESVLQDGLQVVPPQRIEKYFYCSKSFTSKNMYFN